MVLSSWVLVTPCFTVRSRPDWFLVTELPVYVMRSYGFCVFFDEKIGLRTHPPFLLQQQQQQIHNQRDNGYSLSAVYSKSARVLYCSLQYSAHHGVCAFEMDMYATHVSRYTVYYVYS